MDRLNNEKIIPFTIDDALTEVEKFNKLIDGLLELGDKIKSNSTHLQDIQGHLRQIELNNNFYTISEIAEALHCQNKKAFEELRKRGVPIIEAGKTYVVNKENFLNAFRKEVG